jgi:ABC-type multidrug transport system ATPase subunit
LIVESATPPVRVELRNPGRVVIGRSKAADLPLNDLSVSRQHCVVELTGGSAMIEDLESSSGTFVNDRPITRAVELRDGDTISLGDTVLRFSFPNQSAPAPPPPPPPPVPNDSEMTMVIRGSAAPPKETETASLPEKIPLSDRLVLGREPGCDIALPSRDVSRMHADLTRVTSGYLVRDLHSTNGTFVNGTKIRDSVLLREGDRLRVGAFTFLFKADCLWPSSHKRNARIALRNLSKVVVSADTRQPLTLLDDISLVIEPNEFVALLGPSGSGKSTLMDAINGRRPATSGRVLVNEDDFYQAYEYYRRAIGYVPQQDIVHTSLTVEQALHFSARLRLPADTSATDLEGIVDEVIDKLGLVERRRTLIANLSGGQLKRVSLGVELIADPSLLFLDEATSGLDAGTEAKMMALFRRVADDGKTVVCITHNVENVGLCNLVVVLVRGKLAYYGPPDELTKYFGVTKISDIYDQLESGPPEDWAKRYAQSAYHRRYVVDRLRSVPEAGPGESAIAAPEKLSSRERYLESKRQFQILAQRYRAVAFQDRKNIAILLAQAPIIGVLLGLVFRKDDSAGAAQLAHSHPLVAFLMVISAIWFGCTNAAKEIVKEQSIYLRERAINLDIPAYIGSKVLVLSVLCGLQCLALLWIVLQLTGLDTGMIGTFALLWLTSLAGMMMGLVVSAFVDNVDKATAIVPILLIPQVIFAGAIKALSGVALVIARIGVISYWAYDAFLHLLSGEVRDLVPPKQSLAQDTFLILVLLAAFAAATVWGLHRKDKRK